MSHQTKEALFVYGDIYNIQERGVVDIFVSSTSCPFWQFNLLREHILKLLYVKGKALHEQ